MFGSVYTFAVAIFFQLGARQGEPVTNQVRADQKKHGPGGNPPE